MTLDDWSGYAVPISPLFNSIDYWHKFCFDLQNGMLDYSRCRIHHIRKSDECDTDNVIEVMTETANGTRLNPTRRRPRTPTQASLRDNTRNRKADNDTLSIILSVIEELNSSKQEVRASNVEFRAELAEITPFRDKYSIFNHDYHFLSSGY
jgi:hypothetical protein